MISIEDLNFPSHSDQDQMTHDSGLFKNLKLTGELAGKCLVIRNNKIILGDLEDEKVAVDFLRSNIHVYHPHSQSGTIVFYDYGSRRTQKASFEGGNYFFELCKAVKILTKKRCKVAYSFSFDKSVLPIKFYRPYDFIRDDVEIIGFNNVSYLKSKTDLENLNIIFNHFVKLPIHNGINHNRLMNAVLNNDRAQDEYWIHLKITLFFIALESLFSDSEKAELSYKVSLRAASLLYPEDKKRKLEAFSFLKVAYDIRSKFLHGSKVDLSLIGKKLKGKTDDYIISLHLPEELNSIISDIIKKIVFDEELFQLFTDGNEKKISEYFDKLVL